VSAAAPAFFSGSTSMLIDRGGVLACGSFAGGAGFFSANSSAFCSASTIRVPREPIRHSP
jgi:hypothetical protein